jgi:hypothetical protein
MIQNQSGSRVGVFSPRSATKLQKILQRPIEGLDLTQTPGAFAPPNCYFPVLCTVDGGSAGSSSTTCSFTYTLKTQDGFTIATAKTPEAPRIPNNVYATPAADSAGVAWIDKNGVVQLLWVPKEQFQTGTCT